MSEVDQSLSASLATNIGDRQCVEGWKDYRFWACALPLFVIVVVAFLPILGNDFVRFDDDENFLENFDYRGLGWSQLGWAWSTLLLGVYQPLAWMILEVQFVLFGLNPWGYHLTSLLLHALNSVVALALTHTLLCRSRPSLASMNSWKTYAVSALAVALYAVHPLRVEVVAWASCQPYLPCVLFYMLSLLAYLRAIDHSERARKRWLFVSWGWFLCALLSKAVAVSLPFVLIILDGFPLRRLGKDFEVLIQLFREKRFFFLTALVFILLAVVGKQSNESLRSVDDSGWWARIAQSGYGFWFYGVKTIFPLDLVAYYPLPRRADFWGASFVIAVLMAAAVGVLSVRYRKTYPGWFAAWLFYVVALAPNSGLVTIGNQLVADRYSYLPSLIWAVVGAYVLLRCCTGISSLWIRGLLLASTVFALVLLICLTQWQCRTWRTTETLWTNVLDHGERNHATPHFNLGADLARQGRYAEAMKSYREALRIDPRSPDSHNLMGAALDALGRPDEAYECYAKAVQLEPIYADARNNLGSALARRGKAREAVTQFTEAVHQRPNFALAHKNLGLALSRLGRLREASTALQEAVRLSPNDAELWQVLAVNQAKLGRIDEAIEAFGRALKLRPRSADLERNLGLALEQRGRLDDAITHYAAAARLAPQRVENYVLLGSALLQRGRIDEAADQFQNGLQLEPENHELQQALDQCKKAQKP